MKTLFLGDICPTSITAPYFEKEALEVLFGDTLSLFSNKDFIFANLECAITEADTKIRKHGPHLKAPVETASVMKKIGINCCGLSNNHIFDFGKKGVADTFEALNGAGLEYTGFGNNYEDSRKNYFFEKYGERICIIAVSEHEYCYALEDRMGARPFDEFHTIDDIREAKKSCDRVIVIYHGGKEFCRYPSPRLRRACQAMAKSGADVVLCQHSHCIGTYEKYEDCHILYGQGNFHFVKPTKRECWFTSFAVAYETESNSIEFIPVRATEAGIVLAKGEDAKSVLSEFAFRNEKLLTDEWKSEWHSFCEEEKKGYLEPLTATEENPYLQRLMGHLLDCEAHLDVLRELFPSVNGENERD